MIKEWRIFENENPPFLKLKMTLHSADRIECPNIIFHLIGLIK